MRNSVLTASWSSPASYEPSYPAYEHGRGFFVSKNIGTIGG